MIDKLSAMYCAVLGGIGLALMIDWLVVAIISPEAAVVAFAAGSVLTFLGVIMEASNEICGMKK